MSDDLDWRLLDRHLAGEASPDDASALQQWLAADPARDGMLQSLMAVLCSTDDGGWEISRAWSRVAARLDASEVY